jgi:hypothetical protein
LENCPKLLSSLLYGSSINKINITTNNYKIANMPLASSLARTHRALIVLNMHGATLLAQKRYAEARDTFADAIIVAKAAEQISCNSSAEVVHSAALWMESKVQKALVRTLSTAPEVLVESTTELQIRILTFSLCGAFHIAPPTFHSRQVYVIHMDTGNDSDADDDSLNLISCIVLMNMALAYFCLSRVPGSERNSLQGKAVQLFKLAQTLVQRLGRDFIEQGETDTMVLSGFLQIESIIMHGLILVLCGLGKDGEAHSCDHRLRMLLSTISEIAEEERSIFRKFESAASAA